MDKRFGYAILASFVLHGLIITLWPEIRLPELAEPGPLARVSLIEEAAFFDKPQKEKEGDEPVIDQTKSAEDQLKTANPVYEGRVIADKIVKSLGQKPWEEAEHDLPIPGIRLPKQTVRMQAKEYVEVWDEELTGAVEKDQGISPPPYGAKGGKGLPLAMSAPEIKPSVLQEEFPEEKITQQVSDIIWKGKPRNWVNKPRELPTYEGDEEGLVKLRFWVDAHGEVVNAIPVQKLSADLEKKALAYIFSWRFEPLPGTQVQEGIIRINFRLDNL